MQNDLIDNIIIIGSNLKKLRNIEEYTLDDISHKTGISKPFLSQIENGHRRVKPADIRNILAVYGYSLSRFLSEIIYDNPADIQSGTIYKDTILLEGSAKENKYHIYLLNPVSEKDTTQILELFLPGLKELTSDFVQYNAIISGMIIKGNLLIQFKDDEHQIREGENFKFDASVPFIFRNYKNEPLKAILIASPVVF